MKIGNKPQIITILIIIFTIGLISSGCISSIIPNNKETDDNNNQPIPTISSDEPVIGIVYTLTSQNYQPKPPFAKDGLGDITQVGTILKENLNQKGVNTICDLTIHDRPVFSQAYFKSEQTIDNLIKSYQSLKLVLDLRRDAIPSNRGKDYTLVQLPDGTSAAKVLFVINKDNEQNKEPSLEIARFISDQLTEIAADFSRGIKVGTTNIIGSKNKIPIVTLFIGDYERNDREQAEKTAQLLSQALENWLKQK